MSTEKLLTMPGYFGGSIEFPKYFRRAIYLRFMVAPGQTAEMKYTPVADCNSHTRYDSLQERSRLMETLVSSISGVCTPYQQVDLCMSPMSKVRNLAKSQVAWRLLLIDKAAVDK